MSFHFADIAQAAAANGGITEDEILALRRTGWADGQMNRDDVEVLFAIQHAVAAPSAAWSDFFVEAIVFHMLEATPPRGYATEADCAWLIEAIGRDGKVCSMSEIEALVRIVEKAHNVPDALKDYVLEVIEAEVLTGTGPTRCGGELSAHHVTQAECNLMRRVFYGSASDRPAAVSRREAELLFRIKDACLEKDNAPGFKTLFVQCVGNYLAGFAAHGAQISRERALELDAFMSDHSTSIGRFMGRMAVGAPNAFGTVFGRRKEPAPGRFAQADAAAQITSEEQSWLEVQLNANGKIDAYDRALLEFLAEDRA